MKFFSNSVNDTIKIAKEFAATLKKGQVILLDGDLGAGKTHFAKGIAQGLGVTDTVTSPTFTLHNSYQGRDVTLNHFDFYRICDQQEVEILGLSDFFYDKSAICLVEWWQNVKGLLPKKTIKVTLSVTGENTREITIDENACD